MSAKPHQESDYHKKPRSFGATDADWETLKAIAADRSRRYGRRYSVTELVEDALGEWIVRHNAEIGKAAKGLLASMQGKAVIQPNVPLKKESGRLANSA